jgi:CheY-like chemotaxis protein
VLLVDDSQEVLLLMKQILEDAGAEVSEAESVKEALTKFFLARPDVILTDVEMPDGGGYALIEKIHQLRPENGGDVPIAAFTAHDREQELRRIEDAGFDMRISKILDIKKTISAVRELASKSKTCSFAPPTK